MSWWNPSWLRHFPSIDLSLPSGIQRRFLSFLLNRLLGRFVKPGQLDAQNIDSQIGSGYIQVKDVELDPSAINSLLIGLPVQLHYGFIGNATVRTPWPNPLTSSLGLSINSLQLIFHLVPTPCRPQSPASNLAESVASFAETFIHQELNPVEEATLRESFHSDLTDSIESMGDRIPGGFDAFLPEGGPRSDTEPDGVSVFALFIERLLARFVFDAKNTLITLVYPEQMSYTLVIPEIKYETEMKPTQPAPNQQAQSGISDSKPGFSGESRTIIITGVKVTCRDTCLRTSSPTSSFETTSTSTLLQPRRRNRRENLRPTTPLSSASDSDSDSDIDEETQMVMSQSVAYLPSLTDRLSQPSPLSSVDMSMYHSAISSAESSLISVHGSVADNSQTSDPLGGIDSLPAPMTDATEQRQRPAQDPSMLPLGDSSPQLDDTILSCGSDPIIIRITTSIPISKASVGLMSEQTSTPLLTRMDRAGSSHGSDKEVLRIQITTGIISLAVRAWHIRGLLDIYSTWNMNSRFPAASQVTPSEPSILDSLDIDANIPSIVILILPPHLPQRAYGNEGGLLEFFEHPLITPRLSHGYVRVHVKGLSAAWQAIQHMSSNPPKGRGSPVVPKMQSATTYMSLMITDVSIFAFLTVHTTSDSASFPEYHVSPIFVTDHNLTSQYPVQHTQPHKEHSDSQYLSFEINDWTNRSNRSNSAKCSTWRVNPSRQHSHHSSKGPSSPSKLEQGPPNYPSSPRPRPLAVVASISKKSVDPQPQAEIQFVPFHIFVDLESILSGKDAEVLTFINELMKPSTLPGQNSRKSQSGSGEEEFDDTPPATPRANQSSDIHRQGIERDRERRRLEKLVLEDLDLTLDYRPQRTQKASVSTGRSWHKNKITSRKDVKFQLSLKFPMVRVEVRCPPPPHASGPRSGSFIVDLHNVQLFPGVAPRTQKVKARFADADELTTIAQDNQAHTILSLEFGRLVVAYAAHGAKVAKVAISLGPFSGSKTPEFQASPFGASPPPVNISPSPQPNPYVIIGRSGRSRSGSDSTGPSDIVISIDIPCVYVHLEKPVLDGIQLWADDLSQLLERTFEDEACGIDEATGSHDTIIVGSRFFAKSRSSSDSETGSLLGNKSPASETILKVTVSEAFVRLNLPRYARSSGSVSPFNIFAADLDCLLELKPEGRDETVVTLGLMDCYIKDSLEAGETISLLASTTPRDMMSNSRPLVKIRFTSLVIPETGAKESRVKIYLHGCTYQLTDFGWIADLGRFLKAPPGAFESVIPSERTRIVIHMTDGSINVQTAEYPGALIVHIGDTSFSTDIVGEAPESIFNITIPDVSILLVDDRQTGLEVKESDNLKAVGIQGAGHWKALGYALLAEISDFDMRYIQNSTVDDTRVNVSHANFRMHLCADTMSALTSFTNHISAAFKPSVEEKSIPSRPKRGPTTISKSARSAQGLMSSLDEYAFKTLPEVGAAPDMIYDDLPSNPDYLDASFGAAAGFRELRDDDLDEFDVEDIQVSHTSSAGIISKVGGETIRVLSEPGIHFVENYFDNLPPDSADDASQFGETSTRLRLHNLNVTLFLYDGYDWAHTRKIIEDQVKMMRRRLEKIRQLLASGQTHDSDLEETGALLFNSVYIGLEQNVEDMEPGALIAAIDDELNDDLETASQSSWQSLLPSSSQPPHIRSRSLSKHNRANNLTRSKGPCIEFRLMSANAEIDTYQPQESLSGRTLVTVRDLEILDHIKTSTWKTFLTELRSDSRGNIRETESNMVRVELRNVKPVPGHPSVESRLRAKFLPLRLHVDQDALDFLKKFFSFNDSQGEPVSGSSSSEDEPFFQQAEVFPVDIKLDYKPRRVDYRALREGKTIELMNFFHFDGAEMTLRHITLSGISGWPRLFELLNDLWTPDVKATQLVDVISGVAPIRSVVNVGSGVADLILLPIAQYKKDGRVLRGAQKGATSFVKSTAMEALKLGARLATGTQVILEQAETVLGTQFKDSVTAEALQFSPSGTSEIGLMDDEDEDGDTHELISKYAEQPQDVKEGLQSAYKSLKRNMNSAAQTILAVPMEVYERSSNEGPVRAVIRAVPIAVLKPMIGASEAVSKTLFGIHNSLDPNLLQENEAKYKQR